MNELTFGSLFAGIGGFDLALTRAGCRSVFAAEIDKTCNSIRKAHWPDETQIEDVALVRGDGFRCDILAGGFPCQDLSVAGRRAGLAGERSGLWHEFHRIIAEQSPRWVFIENVPGLLSSWSGDSPDSMGISPGPGRTMDLVETGDFSVITNGLAELGYGWAMRVLDAQWFGVPQRRRRVFIVGCLGDWRRAAKVLFEPESLPWDSPPCRETGTGVAGSPAACLNSGGNSGGFRSEPGEHLITHTLRAEGHDASEDGTGRGVPLVPIGCDFRNNEITGDVAHTVQAKGSPGYSLNTTPCVIMPIAFSSKDDGRDAGNQAPTLRSMNFDKSHINGVGQVAVAYAIQERAVSDNPDTGPQGKGWQEGIGFTLEARHHQQAVAYSFQDQRGRQNEGEPLVEQVATLHAAKGMSEQQAVAYQCHGTNVGPMGYLRAGNGCETGEAPFVFEPRIGRNDRGQPSELVNTLKGSEAGDTCDMRPCVSTGMAVRRLTPLECERLQGFPEQQFSCIISACLDHQKNCASVEIQNHRSPKRAGDAVSGTLNQSAKSAENNSPQSDQSGSEHARSDVLISFGERTVEIRSRKRLLLRASSADESSLFHQHISVEDFARQLAGLCSIAEKITQDGEEELRQNERLSILHRNGKMLVKLSGSEITQLVKSVADGSITQNKPTKFTISSLSSTESLEQRFLTSFSCVMAAITGFIPTQIRQESSFQVSIRGSLGWTATGHDGKQISDSARYRMLGNAVAVPVVEWIARRIVDAERGG